MDHFTFDEPRPALRFSLRSLLGVHGAAAAMCEFAYNAPGVAALLGVMAAFLLLQMGVLAACTWGLERTAS